MSVYRYYEKLWVWLTATFILGIMFGFIGRSSEIPVERLGDQSFRLAKIAQEAMFYRATPRRITEKVEAELNTKVEWEIRVEGFSGSPQKIGVVVLPAELGFGTMGGRWILNMKVAKDGRCDQAWMEMQPQNFM